MVATFSRWIAIGMVSALGLVATGLVAAIEHNPSSRAAQAQDAPIPKRPATTFLAQDVKGFVFLDSEGKDKERPEPRTSNGALSPDGKRLAGLEYDKGLGRSQLVIRTLGSKEAPVIVPLVLGGRPGSSGGQAIWSRDGEQVMNWENATDDDGTRKWAYRVYDLNKTTHLHVNLPDGCAVRDWSLDGKRFLVDLRPTEGTVRMAWLNADGTGNPEFLSPEGEYGYGGRLSPDGKRVLYWGGPEPPEGKRGTVRLYVMDLGTKERTVVDEPGDTSGYCWSPDGKRIAYTWQRPLPKEGTRKRETFLITCSPGGTDRKTVTSRKSEIQLNSSAGPNDMVTFFWVHDWR